jgi:hypothetical protein
VRRGAGVRFRKLRAIQRTPAGGETASGEELTTENDGPLLTEAAWVSSWDATGSVIETEASNA